jgi:hypothetical protein
VARPEDCYEYIEDGILLVEGGKVKRCAAANDVLLQCGAGLEVIDCSKFLIMPGSPAPSPSPHTRLCIALQTILPRSPA